MPRLAFLSFQRTTWTYRNNLFPKLRYLGSSGLLQNKKCHGVTRVHDAIDTRNLTGNIEKTVKMEILITTILVQVTSVLLKKNC